MSSRRGRLPAQRVAEVTEGRGQNGPKTNEDKDAEADEEGKNHNTLSHGLIVPTRAAPLLPAFPAFPALSALFSPLLVHDLIEISGNLQHQSGTITD